MILHGLITSGIRNARNFEATLSNAARITPRARTTEVVRPVARHRGGEVHAEPHSLANDLRLRPTNKRSLHATWMALNSGARAQSSHFFKGPNKVRSAIRIA